MPAPVARQGDRYYLSHHVAL